MVKNMKRLKTLTTYKNFWITLVLLVANGSAWASVAGELLPEVQPILHPEIGEIRQHWQARDAVGQPFGVVVTDQTAAETIAWFIKPRENLPFSHPQIYIHPGYVEGKGYLYVMGLKTVVYGRVTVWLEAGKLQGRVEEISVAGATAPDFVLQAVARAQQVYDDLRLPIEITTLELREGEVLVEGVYR